MRKLVTTAGVAVAALALAGAALAFTQVANITLTAKKAGASTGIKADVHATFATGETPKAAKLIVVTFPANTTFHLNRVKACTLSNSQLEKGKSCPGTSKVGSGTATAVPVPLPFTVNAKVQAYAAGASTMVMIVKGSATVGAQKIAQTIVIRETVKGSKLTIPVPTPTIGGVAKVTLTGLKLVVPTRGTAKTALINAGKCTAGQFVVKTHFRYDDGSQKDLTSSSPCS